jgi:hypothetical protein
VLIEIELTDVEWGPPCAKKNLPVKTVAGAKYETFGVSDCKLTKSILPKCKGQLISKCPFGVSVLIKIPTQFF